MVQLDQVFQVDEGKRSSLDSPLEGDGFEPSVPRRKKESLFRAQAVPAG
jgi:hypothetical protein